MPIHVAIIRRARPGCEAEFQHALREFFQASFAHGGVLGATMIVPPPGSDSREFGILRTFADEKERDDFYASPIFKTWDEKCRPLEAWFRSPQNPPVGGGAKLVENRRFEIPVPAVRNSVCRGEPHGLT
jgi:quinol monooxygenase YgiN